MLKLKNSIQRSSFKYLIQLFISNLLFFSSELILSYKDNYTYFFENSFRITYLWFYLIFSLITYIAFKYRKIKQYLFFSIIFFLPFLFTLKTLIQECLFSNFYTLNLFQIHLFTAVLLILILPVLAFMTHKGTYYKYLISFVFFWNLVNFSFSLARPVKKQNEQMQVKATSSVINKNIYVLLFDEYPNMRIIDKYEKFSNNKIKMILKQNQFTEEPYTFSNYTNTEASTISILTNKNIDTPSVNQAINAVKHNVFSTLPDYKFFSYSLFDDFNRPNSSVSVHFFKGINNFLIRYLIPYVLTIFSNRGYDNFYNFEKYNQDALHYLETICKNKEKQVLYIHFFTPHSYPSKEYVSVRERIFNANFYIHQSINLITKYDSLASVIILSDHGLRKRYIPAYEHNKNLLFYKNIDLDTASLRKDGIMAIFKNFKN